MSRGIVTRTIRTLTIECLLADINTNTIVKKTIILPYKKFKIKPQVERYVKKNYTDNNLQFVSVVSWETSKTLYGCSESRFIQFAELYDTKTRKPIEKEN
ncbi:MAG: hypothetical protein J6T10_00375 [Methanobrevibacter sp.]|nr:hypothetical protein [Methanobrevibacter sp.]